MTARLERFTVHRAWCPSCIWTGRPFKTRSFATYDMDEHNREHHPEVAS